MLTLGLVGTGFATMPRIITELANSAASLVMGVA